MITYLDRVCFGVVAPTCRRIVASSVADLKWAFTAFAIAYALFEIPNRLARRRLGTPRHVDADRHLVVDMHGVDRRDRTEVRLVCIGGLGTLVVLRFLFGAGEAGAYPNITRALHNWFPVHQAATAQGWVWMSGRLVGGYALDLDVARGRNCLDAGPCQLARAFLLFGFRRRMVHRVCVVFPRSPPVTSERERGRTDRNRTRPRNRRARTSPFLAAAFSAAATCG